MIFTHLIVNATDPALPTFGQWEAAWASLKSLVGAAQTFIAAVSPIIAGASALSAYLPQSVPGRKILDFVAFNFKNAANAPK
jgi:hypothetical protein